MKEKLFENVEGNQFKLIGEDLMDPPATNPEDRPEVKIARTIIKLCDEMFRKPVQVTEIRTLAQKLLGIYGIK